MPRTLLQNAPNHSIVELPQGSRVCRMGDLAWDELDKPCRAFVTRSQGGGNYCIDATGTRLAVDETEVEVLISAEDILVNMFL